MKLHLIPGFVLPLALAACATVPDFEAMTDHPGHPAAEAAPLSADPGTLKLPEGGASATPAMPAEAALYTCPMHPEIVRTEPGECPICGMTLVPKSEPTPGEEEAPHEHHAH